MKRVNFKNSVIAMAIGLVMVSCVGGSGKKVGEQLVDKIVEEATKDVKIKEKVSETKWPSNEYTKQASKPDMEITEADDFELGNVKGFAVTFAEATTSEQVKA
jgi:hypothetical protein